MASLNISKQDLDYLGRVVATEVPAFLQRKDPAQYEGMVKAVTDTILNRVASPAFPNTIKGVVNQNRQFSKIGGPARLKPYGTVENAPRAKKALQQLVEGHVSARAQGAPSVVGGNLHYANPHFSDKVNLSWINKLDGPRFGVGNSIHIHGTTAGYTPVGEYEVSVDGVTSKPVQRMQLASLPTPSARPSQAEQLGYEPGGILAPETAGSFNPISTAAASEMPPASLLQPEKRPERPAPNFKPTFSSPPPAQPTRLLDQKGATPERMAYTPVPTEIPTARPPAEPTSLLDRKGALPAPATPIEQYEKEFDAGIAANPESMTPEELLMTMPVEAVPQPVAPPPAPLLAPAPVAPVLQPPVAQAPAAPQQPTYTPPPPPPPPSAMDVWNGKESYGVDNTGQYELNRAANGDVYRYSSKYDRTDIIGDDGSYKGQKKGYIEGPADSSINLPSFGNPFSQAQTRTGNMVRGAIGSVGGSLLGGLAGPVGGILGAAIGRNVAQGNGLLNRQTTPGYYNGQQVTENTFPDAPTAPAQNDYRYNPGTTGQDALGRGFSQKVVDAAFSGRGGLF